jgi:hypothetical protein
MWKKREATWYRSQKGKYHLVHVKGAVACGNVFSGSWEATGMISPPQGQICPACAYALGMVDVPGYERVRRWEMAMHMRQLDPVYDLAEGIAGDESDGVFWGVYHEIAGDL